MPTESERLAQISQERSQRMTLQERIKQLTEDIAKLEKNLEHLPFEELESAVDKIEKATDLVESLSKLAKDTPKKAPAALAHGSETVKKEGPAKPHGSFPAKDNADHAVKERQKKNREIMAQPARKKAPKKKLS